MPHSPPSEEKPNGTVAIPTLPWWTWLAPFLVFHFGTGLSLEFQVAKGISLWYLPIPLGLVLAHWWGPRVLLGLYFNSMLCAGYWGLYRWWLWPVYAIPETFMVGLSWWLFSRLFKGKAWLPDLRNTWGFLLLGILVPGFATAFLSQSLLTLLGEASAAEFITTASAKWILDLLAPFAITVPILLFATSFMERQGLSVTRGAFPRPALLLAGRNPKAATLEAGALFLGLLGLGFFLSLDRYWFLYGVFLLWAALRWGIGMAALGAAWTIFVAVPLPALMEHGRLETWIRDSDLHQVNLNLATLCFGALVVGRALSDVYQEIGRRNRAEAGLRRGLEERIAMQKQLAESEEKYRTLFQSARDAIILGDQGILIDCNATALEMFGASKEEFLGGPSSRFFPSTLEDGSDAADRIAGYRAAAMEGAPQSFEWRMRRLDGSLFDSEVTFVGVQVGAKRIIMAVVRDITQDKAMLQAIQENENRYRSLFESATDCIIIAEKGRILDCNPAGLALFRCSRKDMVGANTLSISPEFQPDGKFSREGVLNYRDAALKGEAQRFEWTYRRFDGTTFEAEVNLNFVLLRDNPTLVVLVRDITARKRIERALIESEDRFRQMAENIEEIFFLLDCESETMLYISPLAARITGVPLEEIIRRPLDMDQAIHPDDRDRMGFFVEGAWKNRPFNEEFRFIRPDGETCWLRLRSFLIRGQSGSVYRVAGVLADITEFKTAQEEVRANQQRLIQADKMNSLGLMVSGVAHEINNPNNLIMLNADVMETFWRHIRPVLRDRHADDPDWRLAGIPYLSAEGKFETLLGGVSGGARRIKRIVDNLKDFARTDGGDLSESIAMDKVVEASVGVIGNLIRKATDRFSVINGQDLPLFRGNFQKLEQVVINLITNACQALENRSQAVRVLTWHESEKSMVGIRVEDEGRGIPAALLDKVADPFFTTKRDTGGTGLGLSVSYGIIREHGGVIEFRSEEDRGTTVEIRIPVPKEEAA